jgi:ElaB/YqjD/DUF883 family membrane-anchored ribosome-binding protein
MRRTNMAATTGTLPGGTTGTSNSKSTAASVTDTSRDKADVVSAATTESNQPSAEKILETSPRSITGSTPASSTGIGTPTPSSITVTQSDTRKSSTATQGDPTGFGGITEPGTSTTDTSSRTGTGQQVSSRAAEEWQQRKQQVSDVAGNLKDSAARSAEQVRDVANSASYRVRRQSRQGVDAAQTAITEHPLATGMVALGVGLLIAGLLYSQSRKSQSYRNYYDRNGDLDLGEYGSSRDYRPWDRESDYRRAEANAGYDRSGY